LHRAAEDALKLARRSIAARGARCHGACADEHGWQKKLTQRVTPARAQSSNSRQALLELNACQSCTRLIALWLELM
jgi:hypothetical protein